MNLLRTAQLVSLRAQLWVLRRMMESKMADRPSRKKVPVAAPERDEDTGAIMLHDDVLDHFATSQELASRRRHLDTGDLVKLVIEGLAKRGMDVDVLAKTRMVWVSKNGCPELFLILPGIEA